MLIQIKRTLFGAGRVAQSAARLTQEPGFPVSTRSSHLLSFLFPLIQEGQMPATGEVQEV